MLRATIRFPVFLSLAALSGVLVKPTISAFMLTIDWEDLRILSITELCPNEAVGFSNSVYTNIEVETIWMRRVFFKQEMFILD